MACLTGFPVLAEEPRSEPPAVTGLQDYWDLPVADRRLGVDFTFEGHVTHLDRTWGHFWLQDHQTGAYVAIDETTPALVPGRHVRIQGNVPASNTLSIAGARVTDLGPSRLEPLRVPNTDWLEAPEKYNNRYVQIEAHVDRQVRADPDHLHLFLSAYGKSHFAWVLLPPGTPEPQLERTTVRIRGVFTILHSTDGKPAAIELKIQNPAQIESLSRLEDDPCFDLPVSTLSSLPNRPADAFVHVVGEVRDQQPFRSIHLRDDTGQIEVISGQAIPCRIGEMVEAVGYPEISGTRWRLVGALYRPSRSRGENPPPATAGLPVLKVASKILELGPAEADRHYPVTLSGVVTWSHPDSNLLYIQDSSGGITIQLGAGAGKTYEPGRSIVVRGVTTLGAYAPAVIAETVQRIGDMPIPQAQTISLEHALTGQAEAQCVELRGLVRAVHRETPWNRLEVATAAGDFFALLPAADELSDFTGAAVRIRGVCAAVTDHKRRILGIRVWVRSPDDIQIEEAAPTDLFALPVQSLTELGRFGAPQTSERRVRLSGVVLAQQPGRWIQIQDGDVSLRVLYRGKATVSPGRMLDTVGYLNRQGGRMVLREAAIRLGDDAKQPFARRFDGNPTVAPTLDGFLVRAEGLLINAIHQGGETLLALHGRGGIFTVSLDGALPHDLPLQSAIEAVGLVDAVYDERGQHAGYQIRTRSPADLAIVRRPSWFTLGRIQALATTFGLGGLFALLWVAVLKRRVRRQTDQIREQMRRENHLEEELQRATRLESLGLLAGGIAHDFNNLLTVVIGNLSMATLGAEMDAEARDHVRAASKATMRARDLTQQLLTFAKGGSPVRTALSLTDLVREVTEFVLRGTGVGCEFRFAPDLLPAHVDKGQISQVVQNIVINALQSMPQGGFVHIGADNEFIEPGASRLLAPGRYLRVSIADNGNGIPAENLPRIFDPYFTTKRTGNGIGLATVYSIVRKHGGLISVESTVGTGTTFILHLPASTAAPEPTPPTAEAETDGATLEGKVLLMDDEAEILTLAARMLRRLGLSVHTASDGAAAVAEYQKAHHAGQPFDLVILDLTVPGGMGGLQTLALLRKFDPTVCAVVSSGYSEDEVMASYHSHGFRAMIPKPYGLGDIARTLHPLLGQTAKTAD